jgi:hypothetical protein
MTALEALRQKALATARAMRATGVNISSWATAPATSTTNTSSVNATINVNGATDPKAIANAVNQVIVNANKNASKGNF